MISVKEKKKLIRKSQLFLKNFESGKEKCCILLVLLLLQTEL